MSGTVFDFSGAALRAKSVLHQVNVCAAGNHQVGLAAAREMDTIVTRFQGKKIPKAAGPPAK